MTAAELNPQSQIGNQKSDEVVVSVRGVTKVFKDFWNRPKARAVDGVDFEVRKGEIFGLLGPITAAILHVFGTLIVIFNSARLVRKGEELEHFQPEVIGDKYDHGSHSKPASELTPKLA